MSTLDMNAIYIPVAWLEFLSFNELSHSICKQSLCHGNCFCSSADLQVPSWCPWGWRGLGGAGRLGEPKGEVNPNPGGWT